MERYYAGKSIVDEEDEDIIDVRESHTNAGKQGGGILTYYPLCCAENYPKGGIKDQQYREYVAQHFTKHSV